MDQLPTWISELFSTYVLPYWPWIIAAIIGVLIIRFALRRIINRVIGLIIGWFLIGGTATTGVSTWLSDRGASLPSFNLW